MFGRTADGDGCGGMATHWTSCPLDRSLPGRIAQPLGGQFAARSGGISHNTLGSPIRSISALPSVIEVSDRVRDNIHMRQTQHDANTDCFSGVCGCPVVQMTRQSNLAGIPVLAIYTKTDGVGH